MTKAILRRIQREVERRETKRLAGRRVARALLRRNVRKLTPLRALSQLFRLATGRGYTTPDLCDAVTMAFPGAYLFRPRRRAAANRPSTFRGVELRKGATPGRILRARLETNPTLDSKHVKAARYLAANKWSDYDPVERKLFRYWMLSRDTPSGLARRYKITVAGALSILTRHRARAGIIQSYFE